VAAATSSSSRAPSTRRTSAAHPLQVRELRWSHGFGSHHDLLCTFCMPPRLNDALYFPSTREDEVQSQLKVRN